MTVRAVLLTAVLGHCGFSCAAGFDWDAPEFSFSGFGTFGLVHSSEDRADFTSSLFKPGGAGFGHAWSPDVDSRFGLQVLATFTPTLSAMLQVIAEQRGDDTYTPRIEWANVKYQPLPQFSIRAGRILLPIFLESESLKVGFSHPWVRPPVEVYNLMPVTSDDGVDMRYTLQSGGILNTVTGTYGVRDVNDPHGGSAKTRRQWSISDSIESGAATVRLVFVRAHLTIDSLSFIDAFRQFGSAGNALADEYNVHDKAAWFAGLAAAYDPGAWFLSGEWGAAEFNSAIGKRIGWYVSGGHRWGALTPYLTYAQLAGSGNRSDPGVPVAGLTPAVAAEASGLNAGLNVLLRDRPAQKTVSLGIRWDFTPNADFKVQYDRMRLGSGSWGTLSSVQPDFPLGSAVNLFTIVVDFVF